MLVLLALIDSADDREKFVNIYEKYKRKMFAVAYGILNDEYAAEDAVHEAFIAIARNISKIDDPDSAEAAAYVCRAAKSRALNIYESKKRESEHRVLLDEEGDIRSRRTALTRSSPKAKYRLSRNALTDCPKNTVP